MPLYIQTSTLESSLFVKTKGIIIYPIDPKDKEQVLSTSCWHCLIHIYIFYFQFSYLILFFFDVAFFELLYFSKSFVHFCNMSSLQFVEIKDNPVLKEVLFFFKNYNYHLFQFQFILHEAIEKWCKRLNLFRVLKVGDGFQFQPNKWLVCIAWPSLQMTKATFSSGSNEKCIPLTSVCLSLESNWISPLVC